MLGATNILKNSDKIKDDYSSYIVAFDGAGSWSFDNDFSRNEVIFGADNNSSAHKDNLKNNFLVLREGPADDINGSASDVEKMFNVNFSKAKTKFCLSFHYNGDSSYLFVNGKKSIS